MILGNPSRFSVLYLYSFGARFFIFYVRYAIIWAIPFPGAILMAKREKHKQKPLYQAKCLSEETDDQHSPTTQNTISRLNSREGNAEGKALHLHSNRPYGEEDLNRIREMESIYDRAVELRKHPEQEEYRMLLPDIERLEHYYESEQWLADYEADEAGLIPSDLKRGVLSQDTLYNFFSEE